MSLRIWMDSFEFKAVKGASRTPMDSPIMEASSRPHLTMPVGVPPNQVDSVTVKS